MLFRSWFELVDKRILKFNAVLYGDENVETQGELVVITIDRPRTGKWSISSGELENDVSYALTGVNHLVSKGTTVKAYTSSYRLEEIDNLREYILKQGKKEILIKADTAEEWIGKSFIKDVLVGTANAGENEPKIKMPIIQMEMAAIS